MNIKPVKKPFISYLSTLFTTYVCLSILIQSGHASPSEIDGEDQIVCDNNAIKALKPHQVLLHVKGMVCGMCVQGITKLLNNVKGIQSVNIDLSTGSVIVDLADGKSTDDEALKKAVSHAGYEVQDIHRPTMKH